MRSWLELFIQIGALLHVGLLAAAALTPRVLDWRSQLAELTPLLRQLVWVYGGFITLMIIGFGTLSAFCADSLADGSPLARALCTFLTVFWFARLGVQLFLFDVGPFLDNTLKRLGYHTLTVTFAYLVTIYALAAWLP